MITVEKAFERIVEAAVPLTTEKAALSDASGRVLAAPLTARRSQPGCDMSAMDGYAVASGSLSGAPVILNVIGESAAGAPFSGACGAGQAVRIFTGAAMPEGTDQVVIQEDCSRDGDKVATAVAPNPARHVRHVGTDFSERQIVLDQGAYLSPKTIGLAASAGYGQLMVHRAPNVAILSTGDELAAPDQKKFTAFETVNSTAPQIGALLADAGADTHFIGEAGDNMAALRKALKKGAKADILITVGGASVGDKDLMQDALKAEGMVLDFWKVAMRPGKPLIYGKIGDTHVLGLPGNPVSAFVCALLFARPLVDKLMGRPAPAPSGIPLPLATDIEANGPRQHYVRARLIGTPGQRQLDPAAAQDSSLLTVLAQSDGLIVRPPHAPSARAGEKVPFLPF